MRTVHVIARVGETEGIELHADAMKNVWVRWRHPSDDSPAEWRPTPYVLGSSWDHVVDQVVGDFCDPSGGDDVEALVEGATWRYAG